MKIEPEQNTTTVAPMHVPAVNAPWYSDLQGWGAILTGVAAVVVALGGLYRFTHQKQVKDD